MAPAAPKTFTDLSDWAAHLPTEPPTADEPDHLSYAVPYPLGDDTAKLSAQYLAVAYMRSALELKLKTGGCLRWAQGLREDECPVEKAPDNFWRHVVREGWSYYRVSCRVL
jgi:hypothetical protein